MKCLRTFTDALDAKFNNRGIQLAARISTLIVSTFYLIPQMVGSGVLVEPLLGISHHWGSDFSRGGGDLFVATAGMKSTIYVQFLKGAMLIIFSVVITIAVCKKGVSDHPEMIEEHEKNFGYYPYRILHAKLVNDYFYNWRG